MLSMLSINLVKPINSVHHRKKMRKSSYSNAYTATLKKASKETTMHSNSVNSIIQVP